MARTAITVFDSNRAGVEDAAASVGTATIVASTGVFTTSAAHGFSVNDQIILGPITSTTGVTAGTPYFILTAPSATTFTLSATQGGSALSLTTNGSTTSVRKRLVAVASDTVNGNVVPNDEHTIVHAKNTDTVSRTVTITPTELVDGLAVSASAHALDPGVTITLGPYPRDIYSSIQVDGSHANVTLSARRVALA